jgi:hypothetical protein
MNIQTATKEFEDWVSRHTDVIKSQLSTNTNRWLKVRSSSCGARFTGGRSCSPLSVTPASDVAYSNSTDLDTQWSFLVVY